MQPKRVCLLTGAGGRLGTAFCRAASSEYDIVAAYRTRPPNVAAQHQRFFDPLNAHAELPENEHSVYCVKADLTQPDQCGRVVELALARFDRIDVLVNAAAWGISAPMIDSERLLDSAGLQFTLNAIAPMRLAVECCRQFWRDRGEENRTYHRNVINLSTVAPGRMCGPTMKSVYTASKQALNQLTLEMASEFQPVGIRVNCLIPEAFPRVIPTELVADALKRLDQQRVTGRLLTLGSDGHLKLVESK